MSIRELMVLAMMCLLWGFHFIIIKLAVVEISPLFYAAMRMTLVAVLLSPFLRWRAGSMHWVLGGAICLGTINYAFMFSGLKYATASAAAIAFEMFVPFATILSVIFLRERIGWRRIIGIVIAFAGVSIIAFGSHGDGPMPIGWRIGIAFMALGALSEAAGTIFVKKIDGMKPWHILAWFSLIGSVGLWTLTAIFDTGHAKMLAGADRTFLVTAILYSAIGASIIGHGSYYWLLQRLPISIVAPSTLLVTVCAVTFGVVLLNDPVSLPLIIGGLMALFGVGLILLRNAATASTDDKTLVEDKLQSTEKTL